MAVKKPATKKPAAKKASVGKANTTARAGARTKAAPKKQTRTSSAKGSAVGRTAGKAAERRPPSSEHPPLTIINQLLDSFNENKITLEDYAAHLRAQDRKRLNGVGLKKQGFIDRALLLAEENSEFLPHWLTLGKFRNDDSFFNSVRALFDVGRQIQELTWNIVIENIAPRITGGVHKVVDEQLRDTAQYKETAAGEIDE